MAPPSPTHGATPENSPSPPLVRLFPPPFLRGSWIQDVKISFSTSSATRLYLSDLCRPPVLFFHAVDFPSSWSLFPYSGTFFVNYRFVFGALHAVRPAPLFCALNRGLPLVAAHCLLSLFSFPNHARQIRERELFLSLSIPVFSFDGISPPLAPRRQVHLLHAPMSLPPPMNHINFQPNSNSLMSLL